VGRRKGRQRTSAQHCDGGANLSASKTGSRARVVVGMAHQAWTGEMPDGLDGSLQRSKLFLHGAEALDACQWRSKRTLCRATHGTGMPYFGDEDERAGGVVYRGKLIVATRKQTWVCLVKTAIETFHQRVHGSVAWWGRANRRRVSISCCCSVSITTGAVVFSTRAHRRGYV